MPRIKFGTYASSSSAPPPFDPGTIAGMTFRVKSNSLSLSDGDLIDTWPDISGNAKDLTASGVLRPTFKVAILNGHPVVRLDGINNYMSSPSFLVKSMFAVVRYASAGVYPIYLSPFSKQATIAHTWTFDTGHTYLYSGSNGFNNMYRNGVLTNDNAPIDSWAFLSSVFPSSHDGIWDLGRNDINNSRLWAGDFAEIIAYDLPVSDPDRMSVEGYFASEYAL